MNRHYCLAAWRGVRLQCDVTVLTWQNKAEHVSMRGVIAAAILYPRIRQCDAAKISKRGIIAYRGYVAASIHICARRK